MKKIKQLLLIVILFLSLFTLSSCGKNTDLKIIDINLTDEEYAFVVEKNNYSLKEKMDNYLKEIKASGELDEIIDKYSNDKKGKVGVTPKTEGYVNDEKTFVVATNMPFGPFEYVDSDGKAYGIDIEIAIGFAEKHNLDLVVVHMDFDSIILDVNSKKSDIGMAGFTITPSREEICLFTDPYYNASQKLIVKSDNETFNNCKTKEDVENILKSLENTKIGYQNGTTGNWYIKGDESFGFEGYENIEGVGNSKLLALAQELGNGAIFAIVVDELPAEQLVKKYNALNSNFIDKAKIENFIEYISEGYYQQLILTGLRNTMLIAIFGLAIGLVIGIVIGIIKVAPKYKFSMKALDKLSTVYVTIFRGTPIIVQLLVGYYIIIPMFSITVDKLIVAIIIFGLNSGAYVAEIIRGGISSVDKGQLEAARALGLTYNTSMIKIVIPQAIKNIIPTIGNEFITLVKETSIVSFISVMDLYNAFNNIGSASYEVMVPYLVMALIYIALIVLISVGVKFIERMLAKSDKSK